MEFQVQTAEVEHSMHNVYQPRLALLSIGQKDIIELIGAKQVKEILNERLKFLC